VFEITVDNQMGSRTPSVGAINEFSHVALLSRYFIGPVDDPDAWVRRSRPITADTAIVAYLVVCS